MPLLPLYLRRESTTDLYLCQMSPEKRRQIPASNQLDVCAYSDEAATQFKGRWVWHQLSKPTKRNKRVMFDCFQYSIVWLPDAS